MEANLEQAHKKDEDMNQVNKVLQRIQSPVRIERILSTPQVSVKDEDDEDLNTTNRTLIVAPFATMKSLILIGDILLAATNLGIDNKNNSSVIDKNCNNHSEINVYELAQLSRD